MTATLTRLQQRGFLPPASENMPADRYLRELPQWLDADARGSAFHSRMVREYTVLQLEYDMACANLAAGFSRANVNAQTLRPGVETALALAEMLRRLYRDRLDEKIEVERLNKDITLYRGLLQSAGYDLGEPEVDAPENTNGLTRIARTLYAHGNWARLMTGRTRRLLIAVRDMGKGVGQFSQWVAKVDKGLGPAMAWIGFLYFVPRLLANGVMLIRHLVPGFWMPDTEKVVDFWSRTLGQMQQRGLEFFNDLGWCPTGVANCFVLTGALGPVGLYLTLAMFAYDVILAGIRALYEGLRLKALWDAYAAMEAHTPEEQQELDAIREDLRNRMKLEAMRLGASLIQTSLLLGAMVLLMPVFASNPVIPLVGAAIVLLVTTLAWMFNNWLEAQTAAPDMAPLKTESARSRFRFFAGAPPVAPAGDEPRPGSALVTCLTPAFP